MEAIEQVWAYCGPRAASRNSTKGIRVHAVTLFAMLSGAMDSECGVIGKVPVGDWNPTMAHACPDCLRIRGESAAPVPVVAPAPVPVGPATPRVLRRRRVVVSADQLAAELAAA